MKINLLRRIVTFFKKKKKPDLIDQFNANDVSRGGKNTFEPSYQINKTEPNLFRGSSQMADDPSEVLIFGLFILMGLVIFCLAYLDNPIKKYVINLFHPTTLSNSHNSQG